MHTELHKLRSGTLFLFVLFCAFLLTGTPGTAQDNIRFHLATARNATIPDQPERPIFPPDISELFFLAKSDLPEWAEVTATWKAVAVEGLQQGEVILQDGFFIANGEQKVLPLKKPEKGYLPGSYQLEIKVNGSPVSILEFSISQVSPPELSTEEVTPNVSSAAPAPAASDTSKYRASGAVTHDGTYFKMGSFKLAFSHAAKK